MPRCAAHVSRPHTQSEPSVQDLPELRILWLAQNPCSEGENFRIRVLAMLPQVLTMTRVRGCIRPQGCPRAQTWPARAGACCVWAHLRDAASFASTSVCSCAILLVAAEQDRQRRRHRSREGRGQAAPRAQRSEAQVCCGGHHAWGSPMQWSTQPCQVNTPHSPCSPQAPQSPTHSRTQSTGRGACVVQQDSMHCTVWCIVPHDSMLNSI